MSAIVIGIDNGNGYIKTEHGSFLCGLKMQETKPSELFSKDILEYNGAFYTLTSNQLSYQTDKTTNDDAYVLTLFGIAKELIARAAEGKENYDAKRDFKSFVGKDVVLALGLPPAHYEKKASEFKAYFESKSKNGVNFKYNDITFSFYVKDVYVYPQDYAGVLVYKADMLEKYSTVYCIDIGDGTVDLVGITDGAPDKDKILSREYGMSKLRAMIIDDVINDYGVTLDNKTVEDYLRGKELAFAPDLAGDISARIEKTAESFANELVNQLHSKVPDFRIYPTVFMGGGSIALKKYLEKTKAFGVTDYILDVSANAVGYQTIAKMSIEQ